ncbi:MAG: hypothetical protein ACKVS9_15860 [Phycisphaerae bacterium]
MDFRNLTQLDSARLYSLFIRHTEPYDHSAISVRVKNGRSAEFSGSCYYASSTLNINLSPKNRYPYSLGTHVARPQSNQSHWWRDIYRITLADAYQLALFVYLHELFHYLVRKAGRPTRRREGMCDRFAARVLVDHYGCIMRRSDESLAERDEWDIHDLHKLVAAAPKQPPREMAAMRPIPVRIVGLPAAQ